MNDDRTEADGPWDDAALLLLRGWDPDWAARCERMTENAWKTPALPRKTVELIGLALAAACTNLDPLATRRRIRGAIAAGASRAEILLVLKMASLLAIHSCSLGAPILLEEAAAAGIAPAPPHDALPATPAADGFRAAGLWNKAWDPFFVLDPIWTEFFMASGAGIYVGGGIEPKLAELLSIAFDLSFTHFYTRPGCADTFARRCGRGLRSRKSWRC